MENITEHFSICTTLSHIGSSNVVGKEENAGYQHFLLFPKCLNKPVTLRSCERHIFFFDCVLSVNFNQTPGIQQYKKSHAPLIVHINQKIPLYDLER